VKKVTYFFIYYNVMWRHDSKNVSILKDIVFLINKNIIVLQTCRKKLKELNTCTQYFDKLESFACYVIDNLIFSSLDLETCVNCQWETHFLKCSFYKFNQYENKFFIYQIYHWHKISYFQILKIKISETKLW